MTVNNLVERLDLTPLCVSSPDREIDGVYIGDLLSWVMGKARENNVWITIMSNINVIAVASLTDVSCIVLSEGVVLDDEVLSVAKQKSINVLSTQKSTYEIAANLSDIL